MSYKLIIKHAPIIENGARSGISMNSVIGVTIHMTDNWGEGAGAIAHANYLQNTGSVYQASWHYCIDDTYATQSIPEDEVSWHSGTEKGNYNTISIEICLNPDSDLTKACDNAAILAGEILKRYKLSVDNLYRHYDWSGKWCPSQMMNNIPYSWETFKNKVKIAMNEDNKVEQDNDNNISNSASIGVGSTVYFDGNSRCYATADGDGPGMIPPAGNYPVTYYSPGSKCSIHIGTYGWVPAINCGLNKNPVKNIEVGSTVYFDGNSKCYMSSNGDGPGMIPPAGNYTVTYYNPGSNYPIHIGTYGWVPAKNCK